LTGAGYDSNVFNEPQGRGDVFATVAGGLRPLWRAGDMKLSADPSIAYNYFQQFSSERGFDAKAGGRFEFPFASALIHAAGSYINVRQRANLEVDERARYSQWEFRPGIDVPVGDRTTAGLEFHQLEVIFADEHEELRDSLNRTERGGTAKLEYSVTPLTALAVTADLTTNRFPFSPDRDGRRTRVGGGVVLAPDALVAGRASVSWEQVTVGNAAIESFSGLVVDVGLSTRLGADTRIGFGGGRDVSFSADAVSPYYVQNSVRGSVVQGLGNRWDVGVGADRATLDYASAPIAGVTPEHERVSVLRGSLGYHFAGGLRIGIDVESVRRNSDSDANRSYHTRRILTSLSRPLGF
jgi:hypothetical protein